MNVVNQYEEMVCSAYLKANPNADPFKVRQLVSEAIQKQTIDLPCKMDNNVYHNCYNTTITKVFEWMDERKPIISSNGTFFKQHSEYLSPTVLFLETEQKSRKSIKKRMYTFPKGSVMYLNLNCAQGQVKVIMNSDYGGSGTPLSPFYSLYIPPATTGSAKNMTTTLICCLELLCGNPDRWAKMNGINELFDFIYKVLNTDMTNRITQLNDSYKTEEVVQHLIDMTNDLSIKDIKVITSYVKNLNAEQKTRLMLANNIRLVLKKYLRKEIAEIMDYLKPNRIQVNNMTEEGVVKAGYGVTCPEQIADQVKYVTKVILDNCVYPFIINDCEVRAWNMKRAIVCVTDTDSLMVHFASLLDEFQAHVTNFRDSCLIASALGMRIFIEGIIPQMTENIVMYRGIQDKYYRDKFVFKNEFAFLAMSLFAKKMYAASCFVQEGNLRNIHDIQVTGLSFKKRDSAEFLEPIMLDLYDKYVLTPDHIRVDKLLDEYYALRDKLLTVVDYDTSYHKVLGIKDKESYDKSKKYPMQIRGADVWNAIFPDENILPMDRVTVIPLSVTLLEQHVNDDPLLYKVLAMNKAVLNTGKLKDNDAVICLPEKYKEIPEWLRVAIDKNYCVDKLLSPFKQLLGLFDVVLSDTYGGMIPSRMIFL